MGFWNDAQSFLEDAGEHVDDFVTTVDQTADTVGNVIDTVENTGREVRREIESGSDRVRQQVRQQQETPGGPLEAIGGPGPAIGIAALVAILLTQ